MSVKFTTKAKEHIRAIRIYSTRRWGKEVAEVYSSVIRTTMTDVLDRRPFPGRDRSVDLFPGIRSFPVESHIIYYREVSTGILVLAILHEKQDPHHSL
ncbi:type II toxin-antitoxin system RelE/ParE family toxin [Superficieibacter sp. HKU1]|uniref:type II toxin-antitoxin system RelE/ParE family toxin n=1 Tax=Superficieibacter sp. HKU1 TaxID=3031919 RepID=UPI0023E1EEE8|nr:type II toxin-antitoxin system RelE/ParE family toxin [Superficieibacter sp. HKU1]WES68121.1 type II toxin-antitoxin system RelE/ParE family toxin [Superficieibacter sp. HKU1]